MSSTRKPLVYHVHTIVKPLLIAHCANDPQVKKAESDQMVSALHKAGTAVEYMLYTDEGHKFCTSAELVERWREHYSRASKTQMCTRGGGIAPADMRRHSRALAQIASLKDQRCCVRLATMCNDAVALQASLEHREMRIWTNLYFGVVR